MSAKIDETFLIPLSGIGDLGMGLVKSVLAA